MAELANDCWSDHEEVDHLVLLAGAPPIGFDDSETLRAVSPLEIAAVVNQIRPKIVLSDFKMPPITALEILEALKNEDPRQVLTREEVLQGITPEQGQTLFAILSADIGTAQEDLRQALENGGLSFLFPKRTRYHVIWENAIALAAAFKTGGDASAIIAALNESHEVGHQTLLASNGQHIVRPTLRESVAFG